MIDSAFDGPPYGHFGALSYDPEDRLWRTQRQFQDERVWRTTGIPQFVGFTSNTADQAHTGTSRTSRGSSSKQVDNLLKSHPEFQPCADLLPGLAQVSDAVEKHAALYDPNKGSLLAFGRVADNARHHQAHVVAFAASPTGSDVRIVEIQLVKRGWQDSKSAYVEVPTAIGEEVTWNGPGVPIQQIVFAQPNERGDSFLAVRLMTSTVILQLVLRSFADHHGSRLKVNFVHEFSIEETGGVSHIDVAFNPWFTRQVAIIDSRGQWSTWELQNSKNWSHKRQEQGRYQSPTSDKETSFESARISWIANASVITVCNRQKLGFFVLSKQESRDNCDVDFEVSNSKSFGWILDITTVPNHPSLLVVLTTMHVLVYRIDDLTADGLAAHSVINVHHGLDLDDISLSLRAFAAGDDIQLFIFSKIHNICIHYRVVPTEQRKFLISDPVQLTLPREKANGVNDLHIFPAIYVEKLHAQDCIAHRYSQIGLAYFNVFVLRRNLSLEQSVMFTVAQANATEIDWIPFDWEKLKGALRTGRQVVDDNFVVDDNDVEDVESLSSCRPPQSAYVQRRLQQSNTTEDIEWTVSVQHTTAELNVVDVEHVIDFEQVVEDASDLLRNDYNVARPRQPTTLRELADGEITVRDVTEAQNRFSDLQRLEPNSNVADPVNQVEDGTSVSKYRFRRIDIPQSSDLATVTKDLSATFEDISQQWVARLPEATSELARSTKEQLAKRMAAEVFLASYILIPDEEILERSRQSQSQQSIHEKIEEWELPLRSAASSSLSQSQIQHNTPRLPTPSNTMTSRATTPSALSGTSLPSTHITHDLSHLTRYTTFAKPALPGYTSRVLAHWDLGADPETYDWQQASRAQLRRNEDPEDEGDDLTDQQRRAVERRAKRQVQRQRQEAAQSQRQRLLSSQAPEILSTSHPQQRFTRAEDLPSTARTGDDLLRSSQTVPGFSQGNVMAASQVLPGRYGGRAPPKKKKRKSGF